MCFKCSWIKYPRTCLSLEKFVYCNLQLSLLFLSDTLLVPLAIMVAVWSGRRPKPMQLILIKSKLCNSEFMFLWTARESKCFDMYCTQHLYCVLFGSYVYHRSGLGDMCIYSVYKERGTWFPVEEVESSWCDCDCLSLTANWRREELMELSTTNGHISIDYLFICQSHLFSSLVHVAHSIVLV